MKRSQPICSQYAANMKRFLKYALLVAASVCFTFAVRAQSEYAYRSLSDSVAWTSDSTLSVKPPIQYGAKWSAPPVDDRHWILKWGDDVSYKGGGHTGVSFNARTGSIMVRMDADRTSRGHLEIVNADGDVKRLYISVVDNLPETFIAAGKATFGGDDLTREIETERARQCIDAGGTPYIGSRGEVRCEMPVDIPDVPVDVTEPLVSFDDSLATSAEYARVPEYDGNAKVYDLLGREMPVTVDQIHTLPVGRYLIVNRLPNKIETKIYINIR